MRTIGLLGGMSWESSLEYYRLLNEGVKARLGGAHSADLVIASLNFEVVEAHMMAGEWDAISTILQDAAQRVEKAGAENLLICTNTMHLLADEVAASVDIPLLHIIDAVAEPIVAQGIQKVGLLGTRFTMEKPFYADHLIQNYGLEVLIPDEKGRDDVHRIIFEELTHGKILPESREIYKAVIADLVERGAGAVILGCTEIGMLTKQADSTVPLFDTTEWHAKAAVEWSLS